MSQETQGPQHRRLTGGQSFNINPNVDRDKTPDYSLNSASDTAGEIVDIITFETRDKKVKGQIDILSLDTALEARDNIAILEPGTPTRPIALEIFFEEFQPGIFENSHLAVTLSYEEFRYNGSVEFNDTKTKEDAFGEIYQWVDMNAKKQGVVSFPPHLIPLVDITVFTDLNQPDHPNATKPEAAN